MIDNSCQLDPKKLLAGLESHEIAGRPEYFKRKILTVLKFLEPLERDQLIFTVARLLKPAGVRAETIRKAVRDVLEEDEAPETPEEEKEKTTQGQYLIQLAAEAELFHAPAGDCYASFPVADHIETCSLKAKGFRSWLRQRFYAQTGKPPGAQALQDALGVLEAKAQFEGPELPIYARLAAKDGNIYIDLCNEKWEAVEVTPAGWRVVNNPPVKFRRARGMLALPCPVAGGSIEELHKFVNVPDEAGWRLVVAWLVAALRPTGPYPVLLLQGEQGSAKSTTARALRSLVDPNTAPLRTIPRDERDLMIAAGNGWLLSFDNLSGVQPWLSDAFCRLSTGGGFSCRELYSDDSEIIFDAMRPLVLNGIDELTSRHDLLDRALILNLPAIPEDRRQSEAAFWIELEAARARILGALLDAVAAGLRNIDKIRIDRLPRMADFAKWATACESALPWPAGGFLEAYAGNRADAVELALEADLVAVAVRALLARSKAWEGTAQELLNELNRLVPESARKTKAWPGTPKVLGNRLRRAATFLRKVSISVDFYREAGSGKRLLRLSTQNTVTNATNVTANAGGQENQGFGGVTVGVTQTSSQINFASQPDPFEIKGCDIGGGCDAKKHTSSNEEENSFAGNDPDEIPF